MELFQYQIPVSECQSSRVKKKCFQNRWWVSGHLSVFRHSSGIRNKIGPRWAILDNRYANAMFWRFLDKPTCHDKDLTVLNPISRSYKQIRPFSKWSTDLTSITTTNYSSKKRVKARKTLSSPLKTLWLIFVLADTDRVRVDPRSMSVIHFQDIIPVGQGGLRVRDQRYGYMLTWQMTRVQRVGIHKWRPDKYRMATVSLQTRKYYQRQGSCQTPRIMEIRKVDIRVPELVLVANVTASFGGKYWQNFLVRAISWILKNLTLI